MFEKMIMPMLGLIAGIGLFVIIQTRSAEEHQSPSLIQRAIQSNKVNRQLRKTVPRNQEDNLFESSRYYLNKRYFNLLRCMSACLIVIAALLLSNLSWGVGAAIFYMATMPKEYIYKVPTPWHFFCARVRINDQEKMDNELIESLSFLKKLIVLQQGKSLGADYIISYLAENTEFTKEAYMVMLNYLRLGRIEEGEQAFVQKIGTELSVDIAHLLAQLDALDLDGLEEAVVSRQRTYREIKITKQRIHDGLVSDLIFFPIIVTVMTVLLNFFLIVYYLEQQETFQMLF